MPLPNPVILLPGITGTELVDFYPLDPSDVWKLTNQNYERVKLHPDSLKYEAMQPSRILPTRAFEIPYGELVEQLRFELSPRKDTPVPVFVFPYDWRQNLNETEQALDSFIEEVIERTKLLKHYHSRGYAQDPKVNLIGHSMGGLIIGGYLERHGSKKRVGKVATLGTPFQGSHEAVARVITGIDLLGNVVSPSRERESARVTPGLYHLLPSYAGAVRVDNSALGENLFDIQNWQPSILKTISAYAKNYGLGLLTPEQIFGNMLTAAKAHRDRVNGLQLSVPQNGLTSRDWLCIAGIGSPTRVQTLITTKQRKPYFDIVEGRDIQNDWNSHNPTGTKTGDNTVPYEGAKPKFLPTEELVCITSEDFSFWELKDRAIEKAAGLHGAMPLMNLVQKLVQSHFQASPVEGVHGRPAPDIQGAWQPPIPGLKQR